jgi:hypothetical protein
VFGLSRPRPPSPWRSWGMGTFWSLRVALSLWPGPVGSTVTCCPHLSRYRSNTRPELFTWSGKDRLQRPGWPRLQVVPGAVRATFPFHIPSVYNYRHRGQPLVPGAVLAARDKRTTGFCPRDLPARRRNRRNDYRWWQVLQQNVNIQCVCHTAG